ncbi:hypothetical protein QBC34DRAFT_412530 [Podospora aff. communis PSN243]|uniref:Uncharacterized protein n=1 Tax=Podospora aff. communis PSN243 TaxID=3040156 RepID=A0AAV9GCZ9_9PEZI|nr:hypothetical protein QBC34DRAFT_412530 [Podospora aff. communis PSN243]
MAAGPETIMIFILAVGVLLSGVEITEILGLGLGLVFKAFVCFFVCKAGHGRVIPSVTVQGIGCEWLIVAYDNTRGETWRSVSLLMSGPVKVPASVSGCASGGMRSGIGPSATSSV